VLCADIQGGREDGPFGDDAWKRICVCVLCDGRVKGKTQVFTDGRQSSSKGDASGQTWTRPEMFQQKVVWWCPPCGTAPSYLQSCAFLQYNLWNDELVEKAVESLGNKKVQLHLFEHLCDDAWMNGDERKVWFDEVQRTTNMHMMLAVKEQNASSKLDSHLWALRALATTLDPTYVFFIDAGTEPQRGSICNMVCALELDEHCAGCCGEIAIAKRTAPCDIDVGCTEYYTNLVIAAQKFEYKAGHLLDKTLESLCGFIPVLPGAFSGYRWKAIASPSGAPHGAGGFGRPSPLAKYFENAWILHAEGMCPSTEVETGLELQEYKKQVHEKLEAHFGPEHPSIFERMGKQIETSTTIQAVFNCQNIPEWNEIYDSEGQVCTSLASVGDQPRPVRYEQAGMMKANMFLAEDRILCYELLAARGKKWTMQYVGAAQANVDPVETLNDLLGQRRRWLNGSTVAMMHYLEHFPIDIAKTDHTCLRKLGLCFQYAFTWVTMLSTALLLANFYLTVHFALEIAFPNSQISAALNWMYTAARLCRFVLSVLVTT
jgi:cellulose synthase/poly-beta-1,6-N-acetylglucosamine synthase-like glycosyltransferase